MKKLLKDPLLLFLALGALIFGVAALGSGNDEEEALIEMGAEELGRLKDQWEAHMGRPPSDEELDRIIEEYIREEVYYREALRLGLEEGDLVVRGRLAQKLRYLTEDRADSDPPSETESLAYYEANLDRYRKPVRFNFSQRFFSTDEREDACADAAAALDDPAITGDPIMMQESFEEISAEDIGSVFGDDFENGLAALEADESWQGPLESAYGCHLVQVDARLPEELPPYEKVADRVEEDVLYERRQQANDDLYASLLEQYEVRRP